MEFKARPDSGFHQDEGFEPAMPDQRSTQRLVQRIASALQVSPSALYRPPNAVDGKLPSKAAPGRVGASPFESRELLTAFNNLRDPEERRRALEFVRDKAKRR
jgi:hypothetical protein